MIVIFFGVFSFSWYCIYVLGFLWAAIRNIRYSLPHISKKCLYLVVWPGKLQVLPVVIIIYCVKVQNCRDLKIAGLSFSGARSEWLISEVNPLDNYETFINIIVPTHSSGSLSQMGTKRSTFSTTVPFREKPSNCTMSSRSELYLWKRGKWCIKIGVKQFYVSLFKPTTTTRRTKHNTCIEWEEKTETKQDETTKIKQEMQL